MATLVLTVIGDDRSGLINAVADVVAHHGGNWEESQMTELAGKFAGIVLVTVPDANSLALIAALKPLHGLLTVTVETATPARNDALPSAGLAMTLELLGRDRVGIVNDITNVLARHKVNIQSFQTQTTDAPMSGERLFTVVSQVRIPADCVADLQEDLEAIANELMVDIQLAPPNSAA